MEHKKFSETIPLLNKEIYNLKLINKSWEKTDSIRKNQLVYCNNVIQDQYKSIEKLNKSINRKNTVIKYGTIGSCAIIILCLFLK